MKGIYKIYLRFLAGTMILLLTSAVYAQQSPKETVEAMRVAFLTKQLDLSPEQARLFWPVYDSYRNELGRLRKSFFPNGESGNGRLTAEQQLDFEQAKLDLKKRYKPQFEQVLGKEKLNKLVNAEEDFKRLIMRTMQERNRQQRPRRW